MCIGIMNVLRIRLKNVLFLLLLLFFMGSRWVCKYCFKRDAIFQFVNRSMRNVTKEDFMFWHGNVKANISSNVAHIISGLREVVALVIRESTEPPPSPTHTCKWHLLIPSHFNCFGTGEDLIFVHVHNKPLRIVKQWKERAGQSLPRI